MKRGIYVRYIKRSLDLPLSLIAMIVLSPLFFIVAILVKMNLGSPIIYIQQRPGKGGVPFMLYKFRTMKENKDNNGDLLPDDKRLTRLGKIFRSCSIDELPELWNVIKGDMSIVGPRPLLTQYLSRYTPEQARRHELRPGVTGWAQINGRNAISWEEKFKLDVWYVDNQSFWLDIKIIWLTIWKILKRDGISQEGQATMKEFLGSSIHEDN